MGQGDEQERLRLDVFPWSDFFSHPICGGKLEEKSTDRKNDPVLPDQVISRFKSAGIRQGWWEESGPIIAAVSGGSDSMAMLWLLRYFWKGHVVVAHLEHGFRKETALRDADFVENISHEWDLKCFIEHRNVPFLKRTGETLEEAGRRERYQFLRRVARETGARFIATGHNADDAAETMFFNILRGTGIRGLRGIPEVRGDVIRPIIDCFRSELQSFLSERSVSWVTDESNEDVKYFRNRIRHVIFPFLEKEGNPRFREHLAALGAEMSCFEDERETHARSMSSWLSMEFPLAVKAWRLEPLRMMDALSVQSLFAYEGRALDFAPLTRSKTASLLGLISGGTTPWRFQWENSLEICGSRGMAALVDRGLFSDDAPTDLKFSLDGDCGSFSWGQWNFEWKLEEGSCSGSGDRMCVVKFPDDGQLKVTNLESVVADKAIYQRIPWWGRRRWPALSFGKNLWVPLGGLELAAEPCFPKIGCLRLRAFASNPVLN